MIPAGSLAVFNAQQFFRGRRVLRSRGIRCGSAHAHALHAHRFANQACIHIGSSFGFASAHRVHTIGNSLAFFNW